MAPVAGSNTFIKFFLPLSRLVALVTGPPGLEKHGPRLNSPARPADRGGVGTFFPFSHPTPRPGSGPRQFLVGKIQGATQGLGGDRAQNTPRGPVLRRGLRGQNQPRPAP